MIKIDMSRDEIQDFLDDLAGICNTPEKEELFVVILQMAQRGVENNINNIVRWVEAHDREHECH